MGMADGQPGLRSLGVVSLGAGTLVGAVLRVVVAGAVAMASSGELAAAAGRCSEEGCSVGGRRWVGARRRVKAVAVGGCRIARMGVLKGAVLEKVGETEHRSKAMDGSGPSDPCAGCQEHQPRRQTGRD